MAALRKCQGEGCGESFYAVSPRARFCPVCVRRIQHNAKRRWFATPEIDATIKRIYGGQQNGRQRRASIATGWPEWKAHARAKELGLTKTIDKRPYTKADVAFILLHLGQRSTRWISKRIGRSENSVSIKIFKLGRSQSVTEGYTLDRLSGLFGVAQNTVMSWRRRGLLRVETREDTTAARPAWQVSDAAVLEFIVRNPDEFNLRLVDQNWFMELIAPGLEAARRIAAKDAA